METTTTETTVNGRLAQNLRHMVNEAEGLLRSAAASGDERLDAMRTKFQSQLERMRAQLDELDENVRYKARRAARATDDAVHAHPYSAMGAAAAVGVLIGLLIARR